MLAPQSSSSSMFSAPFIPNCFCTVQRHAQFFVQNASAPIQAHPSRTNNFHLSRTPTPSSSRKNPSPSSRRPLMRHAQFPSQPAPPSWPPLQPNSVATPTAATIIPTKTPLSCKPTTVFCPTRPSTRPGVSKTHKGTIASRMPSQTYRIPATHMYISSRWGFRCRERVGRRVQSVCRIQ